MVSDVVVVPHFTLHPSRINFHDEYIFLNGKKGRCNHSIEGFKNNNNHNKVSASARSKINKAIDYLTTISDQKTVFDRNNNRSIRFRLTFATLTLPSKQIHSDQIIRRDCWHHFITVMERKYNIKYYVMRSERQWNGNLHFHFVTNTFIPYQDLRDVWNNIINKLGYVDRYREEMKAFHANGFKPRMDLLKYWPIESQIKAFKNGKLSDWNSPNTTDIHSLRLITNVKSYICKYISKNEHINHETISRAKITDRPKFIKGNHSVTLGAKEFIKTNINVGRLWACSHSLSNLHGYRGDIDSEINQELQRLYKSKKCRYFTKDYCKVLFIDIAILQECKCFKLLHMLNEFLSEHFQYSIQLST